MSRILLADHSPHAQRMGERILRDEGYEVAAVTDGDTALLRMKDLAPDLILADVSLPGRSGYDICEYVKTSGKYPKTRVVLTVGPLAALDEARAASAGSDGIIKKPFEASVLLNTLLPLLEAPVKPAQAPKGDAVQKPAAAPPPPPPVVVVQPKPVEREQVRAAVILALEASMINLIENITDKVVVALETEARIAADEARSKAAAASNPVHARPEQPKTETGPSSEEPVVRIRTPIFRTL
jgi:CheY-like chemotaxis protein